MKAIKMDNIYKILYKFYLLFFLKSFKSTNKSESDLFI